MDKKLQTRPSSLSNEVQEAINHLIQQADPINSIKMRAKKLNQTPINRDYRLPIPGTTIHKKHKGQAHTIIVLKDGFEFEQKRYKSLSAIAKKITGSHWNGYGFFGLEKR